MTLNQAVAQMARTSERGGVLTAPRPANDLEGGG